MEVDHDIVDLVKVDEDVLQDLEPLKLVFDHKKTYSFESDGSLKRSTLENTPNLPDFDEENVTELIGWLETVEKYAKIEQLNSSCTLLVIRDILHKKYLGKGLFQENRLVFRNMLEIKIYLLRKIFRESDLSELLITGLYLPYEAETIKELLKEFVMKCRTIVLMSMSFGIKLGISDPILMLSLLSRLPENLKRTFFKESSKTNQMNLSSLITFLTENGMGKIRIKPTEEKIFPIKRGIKQINDEQEKPPVIKCYCCGEIGHVKAHCPLKNERCYNCQKKGHIEKVCKAIAIRDKNNRLRGIATSKKKHFDISIEKDETFRRIYNYIKAYADKKFRENG